MAHRSPTTINATEGFDSFLPWITEVTNYWFGRMIMIAIFSLFLFGYLKANKDDYVGAFAVASYVSFVLGLIGWVMGIVAGLDFAVLIGAILVASILLLAQKKEY